MTDQSLRNLGRAVLLGVFGGVFGLIYLVLVEGAIHVIWGEQVSTDWFSGGWRTIVIPIVAGGVVGIIYKAMDLPARFHGFIEEMAEGRVEPRTAPGAILVAMVSLVGGAPLGPEAPLGTAGGAMGTLIARSAGGDDSLLRTLTFTGISGAFGGLLSSPLWAPLFAIELEHDQTHGYYYRDLIPGFVSASVAFGIVWPIIGAPFLSIVSLPPEQFESWMLLAAIAMGVLGTAFALFVGKTIGAFVGRMKRLDGSPVARGLLGGAVVGLVGFTLPITLFSGQAALPVVLEDPASLGVALLLAIAVLKVVGVAGGLGGGMYGGTVFPMFLIGAALGAAIHLMVPAIPIGLAAASMMAAVGGAIAMIPLSMAILSSIVVGGDYVTAGAVTLAAVTAFSLRYALMAARSGSDAADPAPTP